MSSFSHEQVKTISVFGAGAWGTALAVFLAKKNYRVLLWHHIEKQAAEMEAARNNAVFLPDISFPDTLSCVSDLPQAVTEADLLLVVVPSHVFRLILQQIKPYIQPKQPLIWATKGIDATSNQLLDNVAEDILGQDIVLGVLSGPNFAGEVARDLPDATTLACRHNDYLPELCKIFASPLMRVEGTTDVIGAEVGGAVKNVIAIAVGILDGLALGANARAVLITRGLQEIFTLGRALGALDETIVGLSGVGDLILTCTDNQSRNRRFGLMLGQRKTAEEALTSIGQVVEGYTNVKEVCALAKRLQVTLPIVQAVYELCYEQLDPHQMAMKLL